MKFLDLTGLSHFLDKLKSLKGADNGFAGLDKNGFVEEDQLLYRSKEVIYATIRQRQKCPAERNLPTSWGLKNRS